MTKTEIYAVLAGIVACALLSYGFTMTGHRDDGRDRQTASPTAIGQIPPACDPGITPDTDTAAAVAPLPAGAGGVSDQTLLRLSSMVNIANSVNAPPDKAEWQQALPIAEQLIAAPCDCAQRNWLKHFVEMGQHALAGETREYNESAQLMVTLGRNNTQAVALSKEAN